MLLLAGELFWILSAYLAKTCVDVMEVLKVKKYSKFCKLITKVV